MNANPQLSEVTPAEFFSRLNADPRDIMPSVESPTHSDWRDKNRVLFGRTYPGWKNPGEPKRYELQTLNQRRS